MTKYIDKTEVIPSTYALIKSAEKADFTLSAYTDFTNCSAENKKVILDLAADTINKKQKIGDTMAFEIGCLLINVKKLLQHGEFGQWVEDNCSFTHREANNLMAMAMACLEKPALIMLKKTVVYCIASKDFPKELRDQIADSVCGVYSINRKEALALKVKFLQGNCSLDSSEITEFLTKQKQIDVFAHWKLEWESLIKMLERRLERFESLLANQKKAAGPHYANEYTAYWKSSIRTIRRTISELSLLCAGQVFNDFDDDEPLEGQHSRLPVSVPLDTVDIDPMVINGCLETEVCPADFACDDIDDAELVKIVAMELCLDDFITINKGGFHEL